VLPRKLKANNGKKKNAQKQKKQYRFLFRKVSGNMVVEKYSR
jgi:hypothetical protein